MTQSELINKLWERRRTENISSSETDLYYFFLHCMFSLGASNPFTISNDWLAQFLSMDRSTVYRSCKKLQELGFIEKLRLKELRKFSMLQPCNIENENISAKRHNKEFFLYLHEIESVKSFSEIVEIKTCVTFDFSIDAPMQHWNSKTENAEKEPFLYSKGLTGNYNDLQLFSYRFSNPRTHGRKICTTNNTLFESSSTVSKEKNQFYNTTEDSHIVKQVKKEKVDTSNSDDQIFSSKNSEDFDTSESVEEEFNKSEFVEKERDIFRDVSQVKNPNGEIEGETENWTLKETLQEKELAAPADQAIKATLQKKKKRNTTPGSAEPPPLPVRVLWNEFDDLSTPVEKGEALSFARWFMTLLPKEMQGRISEVAYKGWLVVYDQLIRIDKRTPKEIFEVCKWARADKLWSTNFFSPVKLRRKDQDLIFYWDKFSVQMKKEQKNVAPTKAESDKRTDDLLKRYGVSK